MVVTETRQALRFVEAERCRTPVGDDRLEPVAPPHVDDVVPTAGANATTPGVVVEGGDVIALDELHELMGGVVLETALTRGAALANEATDVVVLPLTTPSGLATLTSCPASS